MAHELKSLYETVEPDEVEMARYRTRLADRLPAPRAPLLPRPLLAGVVGLAGVALLSLSVALLLVPQRRPQQIPVRATLADLRDLAATATPGTVRRASALAAQGEGQDRWNATMLLCLTQPTEQAVRYAAQGVQEDPRPDFRSFYLELLLDRGDEHRYSASRIEELMDREDDPYNLRLYRTLLRLAS